MKLYIYNENCVMAGQSVPMSKLEQYDDPAEGGDWTEYDGTAEELLALAEQLDKPGCVNTHNWRVAQTLRELVLP